MQGCEALSIFFVLDVKDLYKAKSMLGAVALARGAFDSRWPSANPVTIGME